MYRILPLLFFICSLPASAQEAKQFYSKEFNWRMDFPSGFQTVSTAEDAQYQKKGKEMMEKAMAMEIENHAKLLFSLKSDDFNHMEANYQPFDEAVDGNYSESVQLVAEAMIQTLSAQIPRERIKSEVTNETIGGLNFHVLRITVAIPNKFDMQMHMHSRLFGNKELAVNLIYIDAQKGKLMFDAWKNSTFN
ncbi:hypothetical protein HUK80_10880 [Flavobacterium sp. MAH-1]|uniref:Uncharacterized protein n=1 Tax=Flavobacterium agri TaxID=2743471 RepID=A0A7Y8Y2P9_9FLAO|nr:hypothetical protein [Flavobacterium agri]NUY81403.1 hypothetical protein [Flavobacterium agri]NYA71427.1 hypothetical protein [Flavobacterium agri]